jgi:hypothetical protein
VITKFAAEPLNLPRHGHAEIPGGASCDYFAWLLSIVRRAHSRR